MSKTKRNKSIKGCSRHRPRKGSVSKKKAWLWEYYTIDSKKEQTDE